VDWEVQRAHICAHGNAISVSEYYYYCEPKWRAKATGHTSESIRKMAVESAFALSFKKESGTGHVFFDTQ
jgi:hypothetical protein